MTTTTATRRLEELTIDELKAAAKVLGRELGNLGVERNNEPIRVGLRAKVEAIRLILADRIAL
jgi:hypothetical protein